MISIKGEAHAHFKTPGAAAQWVEFMKANE